MHNTTNGLCAMLSDGTSSDRNKAGKDHRRRYDRETKVENPRSDFVAFPYGSLFSISVTREYRDQG